MARHSLSSPRNAPPAVEQGSLYASAEELVAETIDAWRAGGEADVAAFLEEHPELALRKSLVLDLAYEEYCQQVERTDDQAIRRFLDRYPDVKSSLRRQIEVHQFFSANPMLLGAEPKRWPAVGEEILDFAIVQELGSGAFSRVYLCRQLGVGRRQVVVKFAAGGAFEADLMGKLSHRHIMPILSVGHDHELGLSAICMPFHGRSTLCDVIDEAFSAGGPATMASAILAAGRRRSEPRDRYAGGDGRGVIPQRAPYVEGVIRIAVALADALTHAHAAGIVHGDLKPSNVLFTPGGEPLLMDFNLATETTSFGTPGGGTLPYMAPEQLQALLHDDPASPSTIDEASDVYSFGVLLYELLTGELPYPTDLARRDTPEMAADLLRQQQRGAASLARRPHVSRELADLVSSCLAPQPGRRPTMSDVGRLLRKSISPAARIHRWSTLHRRAVLATSAIVLLVFAALAAAAYNRPPYRERVYQAAVAAYETDNPSEAVRLLDSLLQQHPDDVDALYLRGLGLLKQGRVAEAHREFNAASKLSDDWRPLMGVAYCLAESGFHKEATAIYELVLRQGGDSVDLHNNLAHCLLRLPPARATEARGHLEKAAELDTLNCAVFVNRLIADLALAQEASGTLSRSAIENVAAIVDCSPPNAHGLLMASRLAAFGASQNELFAERAIEVFQVACRHGLPVEKEQIERDPHFAAIAADPRFREALEQAVVRKQAPPKLLIEPSLAMN